MVSASALTADPIVDAMLSGQIYASNGVYLSNYEPGNDRYDVSVDRRRTEVELSSSDRHGKSVIAGVVGFRIDFIGSGGRIVKTVLASEASYINTGSQKYVRARVTFTRRRQDGSFEEFYAWGQPAFGH